MRPPRLHRVLAGEDGPGVRALPAGEFLHPVPLLAVCVLLVNDHWFKAAGTLPAVITGKLSDVAGLLFFPLLVTAVADLVLLAGAALTRGRWNFSLTRLKLVLALAATAGWFCAIKLSAGAAAATARALDAFGFASMIVADPTDLVALPMLALAYWLGIREIRRVPLGRLHWLEVRWRRDRMPPADGLRDLTACGAASADVEALAAGLQRYFETGDDDDACAALARLRGEA